MGGFTNNLTTAFDAPYLTQSATVTTLVPPAAPYQVSIAGHNYLIDTEFKPYLRDAFRHRSIPAQREAIDLTNEPGQGTVNVEDLWRRGQNNWILGAGQPYLDRKESNPNRFWQSKGITTARTWQLTLLPKAHRVYTASGHGLLDVLVVSDTLYLAVDGVLKYSTNLVTFHTVTTGPATPTIWDMATNGHTVWIAYGSHGIYKTTVGASTMASYATGTVTAVGWAGTYLMAAFGPTLYGGGGTYAIVGPALPATPLYTHPNPQWVWVDFVWGNSEAYIAGYVNIAGGSGAIFRTTATTTGINLEVPVLALPFEGGERPYSIQAYLNFIFVGTNLGVRMCRTVAAYDPSGNAGDLEAGALQPDIFQQVGAPVNAITGHGRFVYFAWPRFDTTASGLGRLDLANFVDQLTPAYTSDLMVPGAASVGISAADWFTANGTVLGVTGFTSAVVAVPYTGIWVSTPTHRVTSGYIDSGYITYGIPDDKVALQLSARAQSPLDGALKGFLSVDQPLAANYTAVGANYTAPHAIWPVTQVRGEQYQVRIELDSGGTNKTPIFSRWLLKSYPAVVSGTQIIVPLVLFREINEQGLVRAVDPYGELAYLRGLRQSQQVVQYVEGPFATTVIITTLDWIPFGEQGNAGDRRGYNATLVVYMKSFAVTDA